MISTSVLIGSLITSSNSRGRALCNRRPLPRKGPAPENEGCLSGMRSERLRAATFLGYGSRRSLPCRPQNRSSASKTSRSAWAISFASAISIIRGTSTTRCSRPISSPAESGSSTTRTTACRCLERPRSSRASRSIFWARSTGQVPSTSARRWRRSAEAPIRFVARALLQGRLRGHRAHHHGADRSRDAPGTAAAARTDRATARPHAGGMNWRLRLPLGYADDQAIKGRAP